MTLAKKASLMFLIFFQAGIYPPGPDDAVEHDGLVTSLPLIIQQTPNLVDIELEKAFHIMTTDPLAVEHHKAEAFLINQFIQGKYHVQNTVNHEKLFVFPELILRLLFIKDH